jgi:hypothetical protein
VSRRRPPPPESEAYLAEEAAEAEWARQQRERYDAFIGPRMPRLSLAVRTKQPLPPREDGIACMKFSFNFAVSYMIGLGALPPDYERDIMSRHLENIAAIVNETVVDDEKAGLLMRTIGYALDYMANLGRIDGEYGPSCELRDDAAFRKKGGDERSARYAAERDARWRNEGEKIWQERYADLPPDDPNRITVEKLAQDIQGEVAGDIKLDTIKRQIGKWNKRDGVKPNAKRRSSIRTSRG